jgi:hypothetical protein
MNNMNSNILANSTIPGCSGSLGWPPEVALEMAIHPAVWMILLTAVNKTSWYRATSPSCKRTYLLLPSKAMLLLGTVEVSKA